MNLSYSNHHYEVHEIANYTNMMVDEHGIQTFRVVDVVLLVLSLLFDVLSPQVLIPYYFWAISFSIILNVSFERKICM
jgi:hypothetical protein